MSQDLAVTEELITSGLRRVFQLNEDKSGNLTFQEPIQLANGKVIQGVTKEEICEISTRLNGAKVRSDSSFQWESEAEFSLISLDSIGTFDRFFENKEFVGQGDNSVTFRTGRPSRDFSAYLLCIFAHNPLLLRTPRHRTLLNRVRTFIERASAGTRFGRHMPDVESLFDIVSESLYVTTLRITSVKARSDFERLANSFLFHAAYNTDAAARIGLDSVFKSQAIQRVRRTQTGALDAPRQTYDADLVHHYLMGVAAEIPLLEYLAYYHIAEHFFDTVFNEDLVNQVRSGITDPSFSARRTKDIQSVIRIVTKVQRQVRDEGGVKDSSA